MVTDSKSRICMWELWSEIFRDSVDGSGLELGSRGACQRRTVFLYEAVKEQRYAVSRSHEETRKAQEKQPPKKTQKKKKTNSWVAKESPTQEQKGTAAGKKERRKRRKEGSLCDDGPRSCSRRPSLREEASSTRDEETTITTILMLYSHWFSCAILSVMQVFYFTFFWVWVDVFFWFCLRQTKHVLWILCRIEIVWK